MRQLLSAAALLLILSVCAGVDEVASRTSVIAFDFSDYSEQGFMFTLEGYDRPYQSVGLINMTIRPSAEKFGEGNAIIRQDQYQDGNWVVDQVTTDELVKAAHDEASAMGADAIIRFEVTSSNQPITLTFSVPEFHITGFAIDRSVDFSPA